MAVEKLFQVLVVGGVTLGVACSTKQSKKTDASVQQENAIPADSNKKEVERASTKAEERVERPTQRPQTPFSGTNSAGEQCEDICYQETSGELICSEMCCWLTAVECCPDYRPPVEEEEVETPKDEEL